MTNAEKYQEVFGFPPDKEDCPTGDCHICPCSQLKIKGIYECMTYDWWNEEYKGGADMRKPNCVTCDHFGKCEGCEKRDEE